MDLSALQKALKAQKLYSGEVDGQDASTIHDAVSELLEREKVRGWKGWEWPRRELAAKQIVARMKGIDVGEIDGLLGPSTLRAFEEYAGKAVSRKDIEKENGKGFTPEVTPQHNVWPRQRDVTRFYGSIGKNQTTIKPAWDMVLAWDTDTKVSRISVHEKVADSAKRVMDRIANSYTPAQLVEMGVHLFGGSLNVRMMRGSGGVYSMHSWGIAIDFDPLRNQLKWGRDRARLARPDAQLFWKIWEEEGWVSLGRLRNYDWMHVQAARL